MTHSEVVKKIFELGALRIDANPVGTGPEKITVIMPKDASAFAYGEIERLLYCTMPAASRFEVREET